MSRECPETTAPRRLLVVELSRSDLESAVRRVALDPGRFVVAHVRRRDTATETRLILNRFQSTDGTPDGRELPPFSAWAVVTCRHAGGPLAAQIPARVFAMRSQLLVCLCLDARQHSRMEIAISDGGRLMSVDVLRIVGSGGFELPAREPIEPFDITDARREFRHVRLSRTEEALGYDLMRRMRTRNVVMVGAGGGGSALATQVASLQPARLLLFDRDTVKAENLNAMPHAAEADAVNQVPKVTPLIAAIQANQPDLHLNGIPWSITEGRSIRMLESVTVDAFFSFVDNDTARICTSHLARESHAVHIDVGTLIRRSEAQRTMLADVRLFEPGQCRGCVLCVPAMAAETRNAALYELNAPAGSLQRGEPVAWNDPIQGRSGSLLLLNQLASSLAVDLWLAWLAGLIRTSHWIRVTWPFGSIPQIVSTDVAGSPDCAFCGNHP